MKKIENKIKGIKRKTCKVQIEGVIVKAFKSVLSNQHDWKFIWFLITQRTDKKSWFFFSIFVRNSVVGCVLYKCWI